MAELQAKTTEAVEAKGGDEIGYYQQQIQMLEAGKALGWEWKCVKRRLFSSSATQRMLELDKELSIVRRAHEAATKERDEVLKKCSHMVARIYKCE